MKNHILINIIVPILLCVTCTTKSGNRTQNNSSQQSAFSARQVAWVTVYNSPHIKDDFIQLPARINSIETEILIDKLNAGLYISCDGIFDLYSKGIIDTDDILGNFYFTSNKLDIPEATQVNIRNLQIGELVLSNLKAFVMHDLQYNFIIGQDIIEKYSYITTENASNQIRIIPKN